MTKGPHRTLPEPKTRTLSTAGIEHQLAGFLGVQAARIEEIYLELRAALDACRDDIRAHDRHLQDLRREVYDRFARIEDQIAAVSLGTTNATTAAQNAANAALSASQGVTRIEADFAAFEARALVAISRLEALSTKLVDDFDEAKGEITNTKLRVDLHEKVLTKPQAVGLAAGGVGLGALLIPLIRAAVEALLK